MIGSAHEATIDKAGRILLPAELRRKTQIDCECTIVGQLNKFEVWSRERFEEYTREAEDQFPAIAESLNSYDFTL